MGYGIPTSWNKTVFQTVLLFVTMGIGKALGGILSDKFGMRKVAIISTLLAVPFLCFGDKIMIVSLIGVMMFSMTMAITLAILVSVLKDNPGLAFGITTIGLFLGTAPIFFIKISQTLNIIIICVFSVLCSIALGYILKEDK
jgi:MFS family permease